MKSKITALFLSVLIVFSCLGGVSAFAAPDADVYDTIYNGLYERADQIDLERYGLTIDELYTIMGYMQQGYPELFYVGQTYNYWYDNGTNLITAVDPSYTVSKEELAGQRAFYDAELHRIVSLADPAWSDAEKCLFAHDYLASQYSYSEDAYIGEAYSLFRYGKGVCQAYTEAFTAIVRTLGVEVSAVVSVPMNHTWNIVKLDGEWYHVDVTWDDPVKDRLGRVLHENFLLSDAGIAETGHYDWQPILDGNFQCTSTKYDNAFWKGSSSPFQYYNGDWYYIWAQPYDEKGLDFEELLGRSARSGPEEYGIYRWNRFENRKIQDLDYIWPDWEDENYYWGGFYSGTAIRDGSFYFNTPTSIMKYDLSSGTLSTVVTPDTATGYIYGFTLSDDTIRYALTQSPNSGVYDIRTYVLPTVACGDLNGDGKINGQDAVLLQQYLAEWEITVSESGADVNADGMVNGQDAVLLQQYLAEWSVTIG